MKFDTTKLKKIEFITLTLESYEDFKVAGGDILDFRTSEIRMGVGHNGENEVDDGRLVISERAFNNMSSAAYEKFTDGSVRLDYDPEEVFYLYNRLTDYCDLRQIYVRFKDGDAIAFRVPYAPLESGMLGRSVDLSNCPSVERDENGDLLLLFGRSSRSYRRTDNNYAELVIGLKDELERMPEKPLQVTVTQFSNKDGDYLCPRCFADMRLSNDECFGQDVSLVFEDVRDAVYDLSAEAVGERTMFMSRISTGEIFVEIEDLCAFYCRGVRTFSQYWGEAVDAAPYKKDDIYKKALHCELTDRQMKQFADNHLAHTEKEFDRVAFVTATQKVLRGEISVRYFTNWVRAYAEMLQYYGGAHSKFNKFCRAIAIMLDKLQIRLSYFTRLADCKELIEKATEEVEAFCDAVQPKD